MKITPIGQIIIETHDTMPLSAYLDPWDIETNLTPVELTLSYTSPVQPSEPIDNAGALAAWMQEAGLVVISDRSRPHFKRDRHTVIIGRKTQ